MSKYDEWLEEPYYRERKDKPERDPDYERDLQIERKQLEEEDSEHE
jgi:hypothetical protein